jgi:hypothetical protein
MIGGIESCRVFKIRGVRKLLKNMGKYIGWREAENIIYQEAFDKFRKLCIEKRDKNNLHQTDVVQYLIKKRVLTPFPKLSYSLISRILLRKKAVNCLKCGCKSRISINEFQSNWKCNYCEFDHYLPLLIRKELVNDIRAWKLCKAGMFAKGNNLEGGVPVMLTIMQLNRRIHGIDEKWITSLNIKIGNKPPCEIDFALFDIGRRYDDEQISVAIGECKENDEINDKDIDNLCQVKEQFERAGIKCYLVFSKTVDAFMPEEIQRFNRLVTEKNTVPILFTNNELEPYEPYWERAESDKLPYKYAHCFDEIALNSKYLYLNTRLEQKGKDGPAERSH